jgi:AraC-like DNA-binding protein
MAVKEVLKKLELHFVFVDLGEVDIMENLTKEQLAQLNTNLLAYGLELMDDKRSILIERIKNAIIELVHNSNDMININHSDYISQKLNMDYTYLSNIFSEVKGITIQQFIINHKIEKVKELIMYGELNFTEIAYRLHYSSVAHLSNQFKKITGLTPSHFKQLKEKKRMPIEDIGNQTHETNFEPKGR